jgi:hypothetical protein
MELDPILLSRLQLPGSSPGTPAAGFHHRARQLYRLARSVNLATGREVYFAVDLLTRSAISFAMGVVSGIVGVLPAPIERFSDATANVLSPLAYEGLTAFFSKPLSRVLLFGRRCRPGRIWSRP